MKNFFDDKNLNHEIDPDTAVALGAAIMAQSCHGKKIVREAWERGEKPPKKKNVGGLAEIEDIPVIDVSPITLGILLHDGTVSPLIKKNSPVPAQETRRYTNQHEGMEYIGIVIM